MSINPLLSLISCVLILLPVSIHGAMGRNQQDQHHELRANNGNRFLSKRHFHHGHIIETPLTEEVALIEQPQPAIVTRPSSVEIIEEVHEIPRYPLPPPTDAIITHRPLIATTPPQANHLHLVPLRSVVNPLHADLHTATKVVEVSAINSDTGHSHRLGAFAVQPIVDHHQHFHQHLPHHHHQIISIRGQPKSRVEMFHSQQQIETLDPVEEISTPNRPKSSGDYYDEIQQQPLDRFRGPRLTSSNEQQSNRASSPTRLDKLRFKGHHQQQQSAAIIKQSPIVEEKVVYTSLANGHHHHMHPVQPARLVIEDPYLHSHVPPSSAGLIVEPPTDNHVHNHRLVELTPVTTQIVTPNHLHHHSSHACGKKTHYRA